MRWGRCEESSKKEGSIYLLLLRQKIKHEGKEEYEVMLRGMEVTKVVGQA